MRKLLIVGAGASYGTLRPKAPTSNRFGEYVNTNIGNWKSDYPYLNAAVRHFKHSIPGISESSWGLDKIWGAIDNQAKLRDIFERDLRLPTSPLVKPTHLRIYQTSLDDIGLAGFELKRLISNVYDSQIASDFQSHQNGSGSLAQEIVRLKGGDCVCSFNYDLLTESILRKKSEGDRCKVIIAEPPPVIDKENEGIILCKPHGSLSWKTPVPERKAIPQISPYDSPLPEDKIDFYPSLGFNLQPGLVPPVPFKEQLAVPELQRRVPQFYSLLVHQWKTLMSRISTSDEITLMGYGFPEADGHALHIIGAGAAKRSKKFTIRIYNTEKGTKEVECIAKDIFHNPTIIECGEVKP